LKDITEGLHRIYFRAKNTNNKWSNLQSKPIYIKETNEIAQISELEYFFDSISSNGSMNKMSFGQSENIELNEKISLTELTEGLHRIYFRTQDTNDQWSVLHSKPVYVNASLNEKPKITQLEYYIDEDPGISKAKQIAVIPASELDTNTDIPLKNVEAGSHNIVFRAKNENGFWSVPWYSEFTVINPIQTIVLKTGWNIISSQVLLENPDMKGVLQPLIDQNRLKKVMDESGKSLEDLGTFLGGWKNNIGNLLSTDGYKVNVNANCELQLEGAPVQMPFVIPLNAGWNIISFPASGDQDGKAVVQTLINEGKLKKVMNESGLSIEDLGAFLGGWKNNIGDLTPGKGYKVYANAPCSLVITNDLSKSALVLTELLASTYFKPVFTGNGTDHMNINLVYLAESGIMKGDEIGIFDGALCVGSTTVGAGQMNEDYISIPASMNDGLLAKPNGYTQGNAIKLKIFRNSEESDLNFDLINGYMRFAQGESMIASANGLQAARVEGFGTGEVNVSCYPNPFNESINIDLIIDRSQELEVAVYDLNGRKIKTLFKGMGNGKLQLQWQGDNEQGKPVKGGVYLCRVNEVTYKIVKQ